MARTWQLRVTADGDTKAAQKEMRQLQRSTQQFGRRMAGMGRTLTAAVTAPIVAMGVLGVSELRETMVVTQKTDAVFKSMGKSMKVTKGQLSDLVSELETYSAIEGDIIQNAANVGLTFKALAGNPKLFEATTRAAVDMSAALGMDVQAAMVQLGKAMQNGAKGAGALAKNGTLAKDDIARLQKMAKDGVPMWKQQAFILNAVNQQYRGAAKNVDPIKAITVAVKNLAETMATLLLPVLVFVSKHVQRFSEWVAGLTEHQKRLAGAALLVAAAIGPVLWGLGSLITVAAPLTAALGLTVTGVLAIPVALAALGVALVVAYRKSQQFRDIVGRSFKSAQVMARSALASMQQLIREFTQTASIAWARWGADLLSVAKPYLTALALFVGTWIKNVRDVIRIVLAVIRGDWSQAWNLLKGIVSRTLAAVAGIARNGGKAVVNAVKAIGSGLLALGGWFLSKGRELGHKVINGIKEAIRNGAGAVADAARSIASDALDKATRGLSAKLGRKGSAGPMASAALRRAQEQARIDEDAGLAYAQALRQYNAGVQAVAAARKIKDTKKRADAVAKAQYALNGLAQALVQKEQEKVQAAADLVELQKQEADARKWAQEELEAGEKARADELQRVRDEQAQDAREAENFRRRSLGMMSVEEELELAAANAIRAQYGLAPVSSMSQIGSSGASSSSPVTTGAPTSSGGGGDTSAGMYNGLMPSSASASAAVGSAAMRALGGITINGAADPEAVARRVAFILGGSRLRMGGGI